MVKKNNSILLAFLAILLFIVGMISIVNTYSSKSSPKFPTVAKENVAVPTNEPSEYLWYDFFDINVKGHESTGYLTFDIKNLNNLDFVNEKDRDVINQILEKFKSCKSVEDYLQYFDITQYKCLKSEDSVYIHPHDGIFDVEGVTIKTNDLKINGNHNGELPEPEMSDFEKAEILDYSYDFIYNMMDEHAKKYFKNAENGLLYQVGDNSYELQFEYTYGGEKLINVIRFQLYTLDNQLYIHDSQFMNYPNYAAKDKYDQVCGLFECYPIVYRFE